jgi:hypothetical protein
MNKFLTILLTVAALSIAIPAVAKPCVLSTSNATPLPGGLYIVNDLCQPGCITSIFVYEESNGVGGLQRGDLRVDDTCGGVAGTPDERVF